MKRSLVFCVVCLICVARSLSAQWISCSGGSTTCSTQAAGIGTTAPADRLHIVSRSNGSSDGIRISASDYTTNGGYFILNKDSGTGTAVTFTAGDSNAWCPFIFNPNGYGNVGIGTGVPSSRLQIVSTANGSADGIRVSSSDYRTSGGFLLLNKDAGVSTPATLQAGDNGDWAPLLINPSGGHVGVGITTPGGLGTPSVFVVAGPTTTTGQIGQVDLIDNGALAAGRGGVLSFGGYYSAGAPTTWAAVGGFKNNGSDGDYGGYFSIFTRAQGSVYGERLRVTSNGNIGIGTAAPAYKLDVSGDIHASGAVTGGVIHAKYQDVAEWVPAAGDIPAGNVVVLTGPNTVGLSTSAYDTRVAGIISARPGIALGEPDATKALVATTGRVRVHADASLHPIAVGDLLVTSDKPGMVMGSEPIHIGGRTFHQPGTIVGKALDPLPSGEGEILVLLTLQ